MACHLSPCPPSDWFHICVQCTHDFMSLSRTLLHRFLFSFYYTYACLGCERSVHRSWKRVPSPGKLVLPIVVRHPAWELGIKLRSSERAHSHLSSCSFASLFHTNGEESLLYQLFEHAEILSEMTNLSYKIHFVGNESTPLQTSTSCSPVVCHVPLPFAQVHAALEAHQGVCGPAWLPLQISLH